MRNPIAIINEEVQITLTADQIKQIKKQTNNLMSVEDIMSIKDACKILKLKEPKKYIDESTQDFAERVLKILIKAANFLDNGGKIWTPKWKDSSNPNYYNWFDRTSSGGWSLCVVDGCYSYSGLPPELYFKKEATARLFANRFLSTYSQMLG